jgi:AraC-like DNA-binding protein
MHSIQFETLAGFKKYVTRVNVDATQTTSGYFIYDEKSLTLPFLDIHYWRLSTGMFYSLTISEDRFLLSLPVYRSSQIINGRALGPSSTVSILPGEEVLLRHPENISSLDFSSSISIFSKQFKSSSVDGILKLIKQHQINQSVNKCTEVKQRELVTLTLDVMANLNSLNYQAILDAQDTILLKIYELLMLGDSSLVSQSRNSRLSVVKRAISILNKQSEKVIGVVELSDKCFCSIRTLEYAFKTILNMTPKEYLVLRRMNLIKEEIIAKSHKSILDITFKYGVLNAGRFSQDYFRLFGEYPSETRKVRN